MAVTMGQPALATVNLHIPQGTDPTYVLRYSAGDPAAPVDLTGWTARAQIRKTVGGEVWLSLADGAGITLDDQGTITVSITHETTEDEVWNGRDRGVWDLELVNPSGKITRFAEGTVKVSHDVTRSE